MPSSLLILITSFSSHASSQLYNMCGITCCRTIHFSGPLYRKPRLHGKFSLTHCILVPGSLLLFDTALRSSTGRKVAGTHQEKTQVVNLQECYLYSGLLTEGELLYRNRTFDPNSPGHHALPRMWIDDNWNSWDEDVMTCFVLWRPSGKSWFLSKEEQASDGGIKDGEDGEGTREAVKSRIKKVTKLGQKGNRMVFRARSRAERDHWVLALATEMERSVSKEDVRIQTSGNK
jgi:hypothetical protein